MIIEEDKIKIKIKRKRKGSERFIIAKNLCFVAFAKVSCEAKMVAPWKCFCK